MKKALLAILILSSVSAFADCSIFLAKTGVTEKQDQVLTEKLTEKGYNIVEARENALYKLEIYSGPRNRFNSMWYVSGFLKTNEESKVFEGSDYALTLPLHMLSFGITTIIPTQGSVAMENLIQKIPSCGVVEANTTETNSAEVNN